MKQPKVIVEIIGRDTFIAPLLQETTSGYVVDTTKAKDGHASEWFPKMSKGTRAGIMRQEIDEAEIDKPLSR